MDHFIWFFYFARINSEARHLRAYRGTRGTVPGFTEIASFFGVCIWFIPLFLFLSLSANDNALPVASKFKTQIFIMTLLKLFSSGNLTTPMSPAFPTTTPRVSLIRSILRIPRFMSKRRDTSEGILSPHSPIPPPSPFRASTIPPSPRSPIPRRQEFDLPKSPNFKLEVPPRRSTSHSSEASKGINASVRRTASFHVKDD